MNASEKFFYDKVPPFIERFQRDMKCGMLDACAVFGNAGHESLGFTTLQEIKPTVAGSRGGYGWMQWTGPRRKDFEAFCARHSFKPSDDEANYQFLLYELQSTSESKAMKAMLDAKTLDEKVEAFEKAFLRSGAKNYPSRKRWAALALNAYEDYLQHQADKPVTLPVPPTAPASTKKASIIGVILAALAAIGYAIYRGVTGQ